MSHPLSINLFLKYFYGNLDNGALTIAVHRNWLIGVQGVKLYKVTGNKDGKPISKHIPVEPQAEIVVPKPTVSKPTTQPTK